MSGDEARFHGGCDESIACHFAVASLLSDADTGCACGVIVVTLRTGPLGFHKQQCPGRPINALRPAVSDLDVDRSLPQIDYSIVVRRGFHHVIPSQGRYKTSLFDEDQGGYACLHEVWADLLLSLSNTGL